jgi:hypothetical protein
VFLHQPSLSENTSNNDTQIIGRVPVQADCKKVQEVRGGRGWAKFTHGLRHFMRHHSPYLPEMVQNQPISTDYY